MTLVDQTGYPYPSLGSALPPHGSFGDHTYTFLPVHVDAAALTLTVPALVFWVPVTETFAVDLGPAPQLGDTQPLHVQLDAEGFAVEFVEVALAESRRQYSRPSARHPYELRFRAQISAEDANRWLDRLSLANEAGTWLPSDIDRHQATHEPQEVDLGIAEAVVWVGLPELPTEPMTLAVTGMNFVLEGPWEITWSLPTGD